MRVRRTLVSGIWVLAYGGTVLAGSYPQADASRLSEIAKALNELPSVCSPSGDGKYSCGDDKTCREKAERILAARPSAFPVDDYRAFYITGERKRFEAWRKSVVLDFETLRQAERVEKSGRFLPAIAARLEAFDDWPSWTSPAYDKALTDPNDRRIVIDLLSADLSMRLAETLAESGERLPEGLVARTCAELERRMIGPYLAVASESGRESGWRKGNWWFDSNNNWNAVCHSCCVRAALALLPERDRRARFVEAAERALDAYFSGFASDGYCSEGIGYWNYGYGHFLAMGLAVRAATDGAVDFFAHPRAKGVMRYALAYQLQKGLSPQFADGCGSPRSHVLEWGCMVWPELADELRGVLPIRDAFPDGQVWIFRLDSAARRPFAFAVKGGHNAELHNHNDVGSWMVMLDGVAMAGDPGGEIYTRRTFSKDRYCSDVLNSYGHPVPRIAGKLQGQGERCRARVLSAEFTDREDVVELDCSAAYGMSAGESFVRRVSFDRETESVTIADRFKFHEPTALDDPIVTYSDVKPMTDSKCFLLVGKADASKRLLAKVSIEGGEGRVENNLIENPGCASPVRLALVTVGPVTNAVVTWRLSVAGGERDLYSRLPQIFCSAGAHYRELDAKATALYKGKLIKRRGRADSDLYVPHGFNADRRELDMRSIYWWTAGHYPGSLWYLYEATGDVFFRERALSWTEMLAPNKSADTNHDLGFIVYCSFGNARRLLKAVEFDEVIREAAGTLSRRFNGKLGLIRSWGRIDDEKDFLVIPDNLMNLELLEAASKITGDPTFDRMARSHATMTMKHHFRTDGGAYHVLNYSQQDGCVQEILRGQGADCRTAWSRGQAWAIYGYTMMYRETEDLSYLDFAQKVADYAISHPNMPDDGVPYWDFGAPGEERDSSAASIMASALLELAGFVGGVKGDGYRAFAVKQLLSLASPEYFSSGDEIGHFLLKHGVGNKPGGCEIDTPLNYGDYYFLEALLRFKRLKEARF